MDEMNKNNDDEQLDDLFGRTKRNVYRERIGGSISEEGLSKEIIQDRSLDEEGIINEKIITYYLLDCGHIAIKPDDIFAFSNCCHALCCKNCLVICQVNGCGRKLCTRHRRSYGQKYYCLRHWILKILGL